MTPYTPSNWYWIVAGSTTQVWSSAACAYVPSTDATYQAWLATGNGPTNINSEADLAATLAAVYPAGWPPTNAQQVASLLQAGLSIKSTSGNWTATFPVVTDAMGTSIWTMLLAEQDALNTSNNTYFADGETTVNWPDITSTPTAPSLHPLNPVQFVAFKAAVGQFVAKCRNYGNGVPGAVLPATETTIP